MSDLTDLEICRKIAEIAGHVEWCYPLDDFRFCVEMLSISDGGEYGSPYNPLTDDALCFQLMIKYGVWRWSNPRPNWFTATVKGLQGFTEAETLNKAICLAIIKANSND